MPGRLVLIVVCVCVCVFVYTCTFVRKHVCCWIYGQLRQRREERRAGRVEAMLMERRPWTHSSLYNNRGNRAADSRTQRVLADVNNPFCTVSISTPAINLLSVNLRRSADPSLPRGGGHWAGQWRLSGRRPEWAIRWTGSRTHTHSTGWVRNDNDVYDEIVWQK